MKLLVQKASSLVQISSYAEIKYVYKTIHW